MQLDAKRNFFSFFSGYLHLPLTAPRLHIDIDDFHDPRDAEADPDGPPLPPGPAAAFDELDVGRSPLPPGFEPDAWLPLDMSAVVRPIEPFVARLPTLPMKAMPADPVTYSHGGGGGDFLVAGKKAVQVARELHITVDYKDGGDPLDARANQVNTLRDNDVATTLRTNDLHDNDVVTDADAESVVWPDHDVMPLDELAQMAEAHVPDAYADATATPEAVVAALQALAESADQADPATLHEGITIDGVAAGAEASLPTGPASLVPARPVDSDADMAVVETGANSTENYAAVIDKQGAIGTLVVLGDSHRSDAIVQTNILVDHAAVDGTAEQATLQTGGSEANNFAEFIQTLDQNPYEMGYFGGLQWNVDRVNGDYYDVNLIRQLNVMQDNDMVQQTATDHYKFWELGANGQDNVAIVEHSGKHYDLVIVTGDYFGANWIFQTNVLLNSDYVLVEAGPGSEGSETVSTGANWLLNAATLVDYGGDVHELTPDMQALVAALQNGESTLDLADGFVLPGDGSGVMNVLFITGNYYDINVLEQTNIVSDSDLVMQTLENGESGYVATGNNELANSALLVTLGPLGGQYVGGTAYTDATLVQTNIIAQSADVVPAQGTMVLGDPGKLADEAAALIAHGPAPAPAQPEESAAPPPSDSASHTTTDPLASVLS